MNKEIEIINLFVMTKITFNFVRNHDISNMSETKEKLSQYLGLGNKYQKV